MLLSGALLKSSCCEKRYRNYICNAIQYNSQEGSKKGSQKGSQKDSQNGIQIITFVSSVDRYLVYLDVDQLLVPRAKTATRQHRAFSIVGPSTWNGLPLEIRILPKNNEIAFCRLLKTDLYRSGWAGGATE